VTKNRARLARERAGLSIGQACKLLGVERAELQRIEELDSEFADTTRDLRDLMLDIYAVNREWLAGDVPRHDYARVDQINGADKLTFHDRDVIAEFMASMPRDARTPDERLAAIARRKVGES